MKLCGLQQEFGKRIALDIPAFEFERGRIYAIVGSNGCGKSTLARAVCGIAKPTAGTVERAENETCAYMPQESYAFYGTLRHNIALGMQKAERDSTRINELMDALELTQLARAKAKSLSGGETARMALARVLVGNHGFLVLDEPTAALDVNSTLAAERLIGQYRDQHGVGVLLITHSMSQAQRVCDQVVFMDAGRICEHGPTDQVLRDPQTTELRHFIEVVGG